MFSRNLSSIYIAVFASIEVRRCQIMIGLWHYGISEMGFGRPRLKCHVSFEFWYVRLQILFDWNRQSMMKACW